MNVRSCAKVLTHAARVPSATFSSSRSRFTGRCARISSFNEFMGLDLATAQPRHWRSAAAALEFVRRRAEPTRRDLARHLGLSSGAASDLLARLRGARLLAEHPAPADGPGRPTTSLHAHGDGPVVLAVDLRHGDWRLAACGVDGELRSLAAERHAGQDAGAALHRLAGQS